MEIIFSADPNTPHTTARVAFVINKSLITPKKITMHELIPGRALHLKVEWLDNEKTSHINVYTPNERAAHKEFWNEVNTTRQTNHLPAPNFLLGDFNVTEDLIDRMPARLNDVNTIEALRDTCLDWSISNTWWMTFPDNLEYTYRANTANGKIKSRLNRIYVARHLEPMMYDWDIATPCCDSIATIAGLFLFFHYIKPGGPPRQGMLQLLWLRQARIVIPVVQAWPLSLVRSWNY